jgi:3-oxoacyl-[acyl-carrier protein] reductase
MSVNSLKTINRSVAEGSRILVTGASGGIGGALVKALCPYSCKIGFHSRSLIDSAIPKEILRHAEANGTTIKPLNGSFTKSTDSIKIVKEFCSLWEGIDALVQLHGNACSKDLEFLSDKDWDETLHTNLTSPFFLSRTAMSAMAQNANGGRIILTSTASAKHGGGIDTLPYGVAKAGVECMVKSLAKVGANDNILVNAIAPGFIDTSFHTKRLGRSPEQLEKRKKIVPLNRAGTVEEVAQTVLFLLSSASSFVTGQTIEISGGDWL